MKIYQWTGAGDLPHKVLNVSGPISQTELSEMICYSDKKIGHLSSELVVKYSSLDWIGVDRRDDVNNNDLAKINTPAIGRYIITMSQSILNSVRLILEDNGEILPIQIEDEEEQYYIFHCLNRGNTLLNTERSVISSNEDGITDIKKFDFDADKFYSPSIFKIARSEYSPQTLPEVFVDDVAQKLLTSKGADGWSFKLVWDSEDPDYIDERYKKQVWERIKQVYSNS